jgi:hypothetical protein|tara:strand:+ start:427 stop:1698 length:1272 start_codon:yes stop_codon:yes gene_type:complete
MQRFILIIVLLACLQVNSQEGKIVTLTVSGTGKTLEESKANALRSAIEQAFGAFISSKTEILNDNLVKDEVISVSNGNIQKIEIISELQIPDVGYLTSIKATVSINKLTSFVESRGIKVDFKGGLFASNIILQELYEKNEMKAIKNLIIILNNFAQISFDYTIEAEEPYSANGLWAIPITIDVLVNKNFLNIPTLLEQTLRSLNLSDTEVKNYKKLNKEVFPITLATLKTKDIYYLRNNESRVQIQNLIYNFKNAIINFNISNGLTKKTLNDYNVKSSTSYNYGGQLLPNIKINDDNFRLIATQYNGLIAGKSLYAVRQYSADILPLNYINQNKDIEDIFCDKSRSGPGIGYKYFRLSKNFKPLKKLMFSNQNNNNYGLVISFAHLELNNKVIQFKFQDLQTLGQIKQITKYEIVDPEYEPVQ